MHQNLEPTIDGDRTDSGSLVSPRPAQVALVEGSSPALTGETQTLLRQRLRIASLVLFMGLGVFFLWRWLVPSAAPPTPERGVLRLLHLGVIGMLGLAAAMLCRRCTFTTRVLRVAEAVVFGMPASFLVLAQYHHIRYFALENGVPPNPIGPWLLFIFTYSIFIPNTWQRAAVANSLLAVAPLLTIGLVAVLGGPAAEVIARNLADVVEIGLGMTVATVSAVVGVNTIGTLRREVFEARQMGHYRLRQLIGSGGMGDVYLAEHQMLKRPCALKIIRPEKAGDPDVLARFEREVRTTARLSHWNNIDVFDYGRAADGTFYYVMEFLPGLNLREVVERFGPMPPARAIHLLRQTCAALAEAHQLNLIHRDIKPANIFAAMRGGMYDVAKLLDFGLAKSIVDLDSSKLTQEGAITGSPYFMAPEQATGDSEPDERTDIYALGAVAYFILTGKPLFDADRPIKIIIAHAHETPVPPSTHCADVPADLERIIMRCLEKAPEARFQSADQLAAALDVCDGADSWTQQDAERWWQQSESAAELRTPTPSVR